MATLSDIQQPESYSPNKHLLYSPPNIQRHELATIPLPKKMGNFHHIYSFDTFVTSVEEALDKQFIEVIASEFLITNENMRMFGVMRIGLKHNIDPTWNLLVGLRGAYDQTFPRELTLGTQVLVCSNLCFHGNIGYVSTKQTTNVENRTESLIIEAVQKIPELANQQGKIFTTYKEVDVSSQEGDSILADMYRGHALTNSQLGKSLSNWKTPVKESSIQYDDGNENSLWRLFNIATEAQKPANNRLMPNHHLIAQRTFNIQNRINMHPAVQAITNRH